MLITSRGRLPELAGIRLMDLDVLPPAEARALFELVAGRDRARAEPAATGEVLAACAGLPLAIRIAGARLASRGGWNVRTLAGRLSDERRRLDVLRAGNLAVRASFEVSFASLAGAAEPGGIDPAHAFRMLGVWTGPSISLPAAAGLLGAGEEAAEEALEVLVDAHLLDTPEPDRYRFHDLLRVYAADRAQAQESEQDRREAITRLLAWYLHTTEAAARIISPQHSRVPLDQLPAAVRPREFRSLDEALAWCEEERAGLVAATRLAAESGSYALAWKLSAAAISFFARRSYWADWVATHQVGLASARALGDREAEARILNNLGVAFGQQRLEESVGCFEQALGLFRELGDRDSEADSLTDLGDVYLGMDRIDDALGCYTESLAIYRDIADRYGQAATLRQLSGARRRAGEGGEARQSLLEALRLFEELGDHAQVVEVRASLAEGMEEAG